MCRLCVKWLCFFLASQSHLACNAPFCCDMQDADVHKRIGVEDLCGLFVRLTEHKIRSTALCITFRGCTFVRSCTGEINFFECKAALLDYPALLTLQG
uniref:Putative secreted protein n=1 Tax=Rhipicephalus microplus TaxID=6941 RepID=A0A6M2D9D3_RHIMP